MTSGTQRTRPSVRFVWKFFPVEISELIEYKLIILSFSLSLLLNYISPPFRGFTNCRRLCNTMGSVRYFCTIECASDYLQSLHFVPADKYFHTFDKLCESCEKTNCRADLSTNIFAKHLRSSHEKGEKSRCFSPTGEGRSRQ